MLRLAFVTDIHHCDPETTAHGTPVTPQLREVLQLPEVRGADALIDLGDRSTETLSVEGDRKLLGEVAACFGEVEVKRLHVNGNHDLVRLSPQDHAEALGAPLGSHTLDLQGFTLVVWQLNPRIVMGEPGLEITEADLDWLRDTLASATLPTIVLTHFPLDGGNMNGNFYFQGDLSHFGTYLNHQAALEIIRTTGYVVACFAGHTHWNKVTTLDGIHFVTLQSFTETFTTFPDYALSYGLLEITPEHFSWTVMGADPVHYRLPVRPAGYAWKQMPLELLARFKRLATQGEQPLDDLDNADFMKSFRERPVSG